MSLSELYTKDARVWLPDPNLVWKCATLLEDFKGQKQLAIRYDDGSDDRINVKSTNELPHLRNPEILIGENDLTSLSYLHEPAVLYNLQVRFCERNYIYTYCGIVLVAINPYQQLPIYDNDTIRAYSGQDMASMDPHIFAVAEEAFKRMTRFEENQSIIVSGESGAGKTVSAKYAMRYFATVCGAEAETQIEKRVLASNPIMEAIGNAKTTRNDNSSRFGKYIQIGFSKNEHILGANMRTYLLEKSRVVFQAPEERNYHIFYQLCSGRGSPEFKEFKLDHPDEFFYTNQGSSPVVGTVDDADDFLNTRQALGVLGINAVKQMEIFRILAGILHLGNVEILEDEKSSEATVIPPKDHHLPLMAKLLGIDTDQMRFWLCNKKIVTVNETLTVPLTLAQVYFSRDALAKHIYSQLFLWIVTELNKSLSSTAKMSKFIGVLDIYGFETFEVNSFEQFCINFANEKLQQQFCLHVFKLEQEEYVKEQIEWSFIDFYDNQPCIDLIEGKLGIIDLLDEECKLPKGSDQNWCRKLYEKFGKNKHFGKPRMSQAAFIIHHFADNVEYQCDGFLEKNRDTVLEEQINILKASEHELIAELFNEKVEAVAGQGGQSRGGSARSHTLRPAREQPKSTAQTKQHRKTVGAQFSESLKFLMETLFSTTPHYVRCIKPNDQKQPFKFEPIRAVQQLRACGVLETIRISAAGYPSRWIYADFFKRYRLLAKSKDIIRSDLRKTCENFLGKIITDRDKYQFGKTKIFFRAGQVAYLEKLRSDRLRACSIMIQKIVRGWLAKRRYMKIKKMARLVQKYGRGVLARKHALFLRQTKAATIIRAVWLRYVSRKKYLAVRSAVITVQSFARGLIGRHKFTSIVMSRKVMAIQRYIRGWLARRHYRRIQRGIVKMQANVRRRIAKREFKELKIEARSVEHIKHVNKGLENKIIELQQKLDDKAREVSVMREEQLQVNEIKNEVAKLRGVQHVSKSMSGRIEELEMTIERLTAELSNEKKEREKVVVEKENIKKETHEIIEALGLEKVWLKEELEKANNELKQYSESQEALVKQKVEEANEAVKQEFESERIRHQKLVKDYARLEQRFENLQNDIQLQIPSVGGKSLHSRSPSNVSNISNESESSGEKNDQDQGYGTSRKTQKENEQSNGADIEKQPTENAKDLVKSEKMATVEPKDVPLVLRMQQRIQDLEKDKARLFMEVDRRDFGSDVLNGVGEHSELQMYEAFKIQDLKLDNARMKNDLVRLQRAIAEGAVSFDMKGTKTKIAASQLMEQFEQMREESKSKQSECTHLRALLASKSRALQKAGIDSHTTTESIPLNEDGELEIAYQSQKDLNMLLQNELQRIQEVLDLRESDFRRQIEELNADNERQRKALSQAISQNPDAKLESAIQFEIARLTAENLSLHKKIDELHSSSKKLKWAIKIYSKRLKSTDVRDAQAELEREMAAAEEFMPAVKYHSSREFTGMFEYRKEDEPLLIKNLIFELTPQMMMSHMPGLPAHILFMCMRYTDHMNDDEKVRSLLTNSINGIKKVVKNHQEDMEIVTSWLSNTCCLLNCMKQYSGEKMFQSENTPKQNEQCFRNFDLSEYRQILNDLGVWIYQGLIKMIEAQIQPMIVGAILENESISGLSTGKPSGFRRGASNTSASDDTKDYSPEQLVNAIKKIYKMLKAFDIEDDLIRQLLKQLLYFICANALNNLLLRKDMCHWMRGLQMRYNLTQLEQWLRDTKEHDAGTLEALEPILQASQLLQVLQARKTDEDVESICEMCSKLTTPQIIKILHLYTPLNEFEERVPVTFIRKIQEKLSGNTKDSAQSLLMDTKFVYAITFKFSPSALALETVSAPDEWSLGFLKKI